MNLEAPRREPRCGQGLSGWGYQSVRLTTMYHQYGDTRFPAEFGPGHAHGGVESSGATGRYMYGPYYGHKGPDGGPFGTVNPSPSAMQSYSGKPPPAAVQDNVYASRWGAPGYMRAAGPKPPSDYNMIYSAQVSSDQASLCEHRGKKFCVVHLVIKVE